MPDEFRDIERLIAESSMGSQGAWSVQSHAPDADVERIMGLIAQHDVAPEPTSTSHCSGHHSESIYCTDPATRPEQFAKLLAELRRQVSVEQDNAVLAYRTYRASADTLAGTCHLTFYDSQQDINNAHRLLAFVSATPVNTPSRFQRAGSAWWSALKKLPKALTEHPDLIWGDLEDEVFDLAEFDVSIASSKFSPSAGNLDRAQLWVLLRLMAVGRRQSARPIVIVDDARGDMRTTDTRMNGVVLTKTACVSGGFLEAAKEAIGDYADRDQKMSASAAVLEELRSVAEAFAVHLPDDQQEEPGAIIYVDDPADVAPLLKFEGRSVEHTRRHNSTTESPPGNLAVIDPPLQGPPEP
ncbi:hypothetical protein ACIBEH_13575 [Nocardia salmonicida]|uniref:hypothetical protein n=1 Tax=Nocardia salmonicida TaxID=53431 RepID=UPI00379E1FCE